MDLGRSATSVPYPLESLMINQKALAALGLIERTEYQVVPPKVEYTLTPVGRSLLPIIAQMAEWGTQYLLRDPVLPKVEE